MPRALREILVLRELEELSYRQISDITALPIGTVMSRLARARKAFGDAWGLRDKRYWLNRHRNLCAAPNLVRRILHSRRRFGLCEFSARLFWQ